jgi:amino acid adenylation domain-containing protein
MARGGEGSGSELVRQEEFWKVTLAGLPEDLALPTDRVRPPVSSGRGGSVRLEVDAGIAGRLSELGRSCGATVFMVLHAGVAALLTRLGAGTDIPLGAPVAGRADEMLDELVGFFVNTLVLRVDTSGDPTFRELLGRVRESDLAAYSHQEVPFERVVEIVNPARSASRHPLFQIMISFEDPGAEDLALRGVQARIADADIATAKFDLVFRFRGRQGQDIGQDSLVVIIEYAADLFDEVTAKTLSGRLVRLLGAVAADPDVRLGRVEILAVAERKQILCGWNDTAVPVPAATLPELFEAQVARSPDAVAVVCGDRELTYQELDTRANQLARLLISEGVGPEQIVAFMLPRSVDMVIAVFAILAAGAAYLPISADYPTERIRFVLHDANPCIVLTSRSIASRVPEADDRLVIIEELQTENCDASPISDAERTIALRAQHPAYVIYTSGSTGTPKGVVMPGAPLVNLLSYHASAIPIAPEARVAQFAAIGFDVAAQEILSTLYGGGCVLIAGDDTRRDPHAFARWLESYRVTRLHMPNLVLQAICEAANELNLAIPELLEIVQAGEALVLSSHLATFQSLSDNRALYNHYGPTETHLATAYTLVENVSDWPSRAPIGRPIDNARVFVLDAGLQPVPIGVAGELYIAGAGLARGYLARPALTADRFVACPFGHPGERMYRTGDMARWMSNGNLEFVGRADDQVKVRGFRIELGEVQTILSRHLLVEHVVVVVREDMPGDRRIVAYVVLADGGAAEVGALRAFTAGKLPEYMVPSAFVCIDEIPLTLNGKLDRGALPAPNYLTAASDRGPSSPHEKLLSTLFAEVLGVQRVGLDDSFFDLGGHSLLASRLINRIRLALAWDLQMEDFFSYPTISGLLNKYKSEH